MLVTRSNFESVVSSLQQSNKLALDTETSGLRAWHGDRLFSIIIADGQTSYYFNFQPYAGIEPDQVLLPMHLSRLQPLLADPSKTWYMHNAKFDLAMLAQEQLTVAGTVHCTRAIARVEYNEYQNYDLASCADRIGFKKDDAVEKYIDEHHLWEWESRPGRKQRNKNKHFDRVPFEIIVPYGCRDAEITARLGEHQEKTLQGIADKQKVTKITTLAETEKRLTKTIFRMESRGVLIDRDYCTKASAYEMDRGQKALQAFKLETGKDFSASPLLFKEIFASEKEKWKYGEPTKTGQVNPSFDSDVLASFVNPAARAILNYRDAKSKSDFYAGFLYHADANGVIHPNFNPDGARTGRFSSSEPNLQNLTSEEGEEGNEFIVRRALIPRPGFVFLMPDYDQMEYRMMFDYACDIAGRETELVRKIKYEGLDPHQATADVVTSGGTPLTRKRAKNGNFAVLYGSGYDTLAATIGSTRAEAKALKEAILNASPEIREFVNSVMDTVRTRGWVRTWLGRRCYFPDADYAYKSPNSLIQGGCADVNKVALNETDEYLLEKRSKLVLTIHDENVIEAHEDEADEVARHVQGLMQNVYPSKYLPLTVGMEWSPRSLGDKIKGFPHGLPAQLQTVQQANCV